MSLYKAVQQLSKDERAQLEGLLKKEDRANFIWEGVIQFFMKLVKIYALVLVFSLVAPLKTVLVTALILTGLHLVMEVGVRLIPQPNFTDPSSFKGIWFVTTSFYGLVLGLTVLSWITLEHFIGLTEGAFAAFWFYKAACLLWRLIPTYLGYWILEKKVKEVVAYRDN